MKPTTQYRLADYLKKRKEIDAEKAPREPSGFMKKPDDSTPGVPESPKRRASSTC